jgi:sulfate transport system ATP-binding protein
VVVMSEGRIEQIGTPDQVYDTPNSPFVFSFIGESSLLPVQVEKGKVWLDERPLDLVPRDVPAGPAKLSSARTTSTSATICPGPSQA